jgi:hypothetical protein
MVTIVARLTEDNRVHELVLDHYRGEDHYSIQTAVDGQPVGMRTLTRQEAGEWVELAERGGCVHEVTP